MLYCVDGYVVFGGFVGVIGVIYIVVFVIYDFFGNLFDVYGYFVFLFVRSLCFRF